MLVRHYNESLLYLLLLLCIPPDLQRMLKALCEFDVCFPCQWLQCMRSSIYILLQICNILQCGCVGSWVVVVFCVCFFGGGGCCFLCVCVFHTVKPHGRPDGWVCQNDLLHTKSCLRRTKLQENGAIVGHFNLWSEIELFTVFKHQTSQSMPCPRCVRSTNTEIT